MFCKYCGVENNDEARFCRGCGKEIIAVPVNSSADVEIPKEPEPEKVEPESVGQTTSSVGTETMSDIPVPPGISGKPEKKKSIPGAVIAGICAGFAVLLIVIAVILNSGPTIKLDDYLVVETEGYDGYGTAKAYIDWGAIEEKYGKKLKLRGKLAGPEYGELMGLFGPLDYLQEFVRVSLDKTSDLSNGDELAYSWNVDEELVKQTLNCNVKFSDGNQKVEGLEPVEKKDIFKDVILEYDGIAPNSYAHINYTGSEFSPYNFVLDKTNNIKNGDIIKVTLDVTDMSYYAGHFGWVPESLSKDFKVSGLQEYVGSYGDLSEDFLSKARKDAEDTILAYAASSYGKASSLSDLSYAGYILNSAKEGSGYLSSYNNLYIILSGTVSNTEGKFANTKVYFPVRFSNILTGDDGITYDGKPNIEGHSNIDSIWNSTKGYINPLNCYSELVEANRDQYDSECGDGFEVYDEYETIGKLDDIGKGYRDSLGAEAKDLIESNAAKDYKDNMALSDLKVSGEYLLIAKNQGDDFKLNNKYYVVYSGTVSSIKGKFDPVTVYYPVEYDGIVKLPGDEYMVTASPGLQGRSKIPDSYYTIDGYVDGTEMYSDIVTANRDNYTYEASGDLTSFGN